VVTDQQARVEDADDNESIPEMQPGSDEDNDDESDTGSNHEGEGEAQDNLRSIRWMAPTIINAKKAHKKIKGILKPLRTTGNGHKDPGLDLLLRSHLEGMSHFLWAYINPNSKTYNKWLASSLLTATALQRGPWFARRLRDWTAAFIKDLKMWAIGMHGRNKSSNFFEITSVVDILNHLPHSSPAYGWSGAGHLYPNVAITK